MRFIQREGTVGTVTFTGDSARLLKDGVVVVDWTTGGALQNVPQGAGYTLEVKIGGVVQAPEEIAIGTVVAALGQSNMGIWFRGPTAVPAAAEIYQLQSNGSWGDVEGPGARAFAAALAAQTGAPVAIINSALGGTGLVFDKGNGRWLDRSQGSFYDAAVDAIASTNGQAELVLWMQGETDASSGEVTTPEYAAALTELLDWVREDFGDPDILIGELHKNGYGATDKYAPIRLAQQQVAGASATDKIFIGATAVDLETYDGVHLTGAARALVADRMAISALALAGIDAARPVSVGTSGDDTRTGGSGRNEIRGLGGNDSLSGGGESDVLLGGDGNDTVLGGTGTDYLRGEEGHDVLSGEAGNDVLAGGAGNDSLDGGADADEIWADRGVDTIVGGAGDDLLVGGAGDDTIDGGDGQDTVLFTNRRADYSWTVSGNTVTIEHTAANVAGFDANKDDGVDVLTGVEFLHFADQTVQIAGVPGVLKQGTAVADTLIGGLGNDTLIGLAGNDTLEGRDGDDSLQGGDGADTLHGGAGIDTLEGGLGNDALRVDRPEDVVIEHAGGGTGDVVASTSPWYILPAHVEKLLLNGGTGVNDGAGNELANKLTGNVNGNRISGLAGDDTLEGVGGNDTLIGGDGIDTALMQGSAAQYGWSVTGQTVSITQSSGALVDGSDLLIGVEKLQFADQTVSLALGVAPALFSGGADTLDFADAFAGAHAANSLYASLGGNDRVTLPGDRIAALFAGYDLTRLFEAGGGNDTVIGSAFADRIDGGTEDDTLTGGGGDDQLDGGAGTDTAIFSGTRAQYDWTVSGDTVAIEHFDPLTTDDAVDTLTRVEFLQFSDQLVSLLPQALFSADDDVVDFNFTVAGSYVAGTQYAALAGDDAVVLPSTAGAAAQSGYDTAQPFDAGDGDDTVTGGSLADTIDGGFGDDSISGGASQDTIDGGAGDDTVDGGAGSDTLIGGSGIDTIDYSGFPGSATVNLTLTTAQSTGTGGTDTISGFENVNGAAGADNLVGTTGANVMRGNAGNDAISGIGGADTLIGDGGNDNLNGGNGNDTITGGLGRDVLTGGGDADRFTYTALSDSPAGAARDLIRDFVQGVDLIDLAAIDAVPATGPDDAFAFIGTAAFSGTAGELRHAASGTATVISADSDGDGIADFQIQLTGVFALGAGDFFL